MNMIDLFLDERVEIGKTHEYLTISCIAFSSAIWHVQYRKVKRLAEARKSRKLGVLKDILEEGGGFADKGLCEIPITMLNLKYTTNDIPKMSGRNNAWSTLFYLVAGRIMASIFRQLPAFPSVSIYHDPKSLGEELQQAWKKSLKDQTPVVARSVADQFKKKISGVLVINGIYEIHKAGDNRFGNSAQAGVYLADQLCRIDNDILETIPSPRRVEVTNFSPFVLEFFNKFKPEPGMGDPMLVSG